jgi:hypothetical protein
VRDSTEKIMISAAHIVFMCDGLQAEMAALTPDGIGQTLSSDPVQNAEPSARRGNTRVYRVTM